jgi:hypothetical protein
MNRDGHDLDAEQVVHVERQPLTPRLLALDLVPTVLFALGAVALNGDPRLVTLAIGYPLLRLLAFTGPHRRRLVVTDRAILRQPVLVPLADVTGVEVVDRATMGRIESGPGHNVLLGPGATDGVALWRRTPEGLEHRVVVPSRDPAELAAVIERTRVDAALPALPDAPQALPLRTRQGADPVLAGVPLAVALALDVAVAVGGAGAVPILSLLWAALVLWGVLRRVEVDATGVRVGTARFEPRQLESVRLVSRAEALGIPPRVSRRPLWGPPYALVLLLRDDGRRYHGEERRRIALLAVPQPVDLTELRRALPPA